VESGLSLHRIEGYAASLFDLYWSPDGSILASCGDDGTILLWDIESGDPLHTMRRDRPYERLNITDIKGISEIQKTSLLTLGAFEESNVSG